LALLALTTTGNAVVPPDTSVALTMRALACQIPVDALRRMRYEDTVWEYSG
jgi:hypothetical protein